jgi:YbbR domain-containing protein
MRRIWQLIVRDWPLKLAAIGLAVVLYGGVALSENTRTWPGAVPIEVLRPPVGGALLEQPGAVSEIRYRAPLDVARGLTAGSFRASIDLSGVEAAVGADPVPVPVSVYPIDPRVGVVDFTPRSVNVRVDQVVTRRMPVSIDQGAVPEGIVIGPTVVEPATVVVEGASTRLAAIRTVTGIVAIDASGLNIDQDVTLEALDEAGVPVPGVIIRPATVHVVIPVARQLAYATLPVVPDIVGDPGSGSRLAGVSVEPRTVTVAGEDAAVRALSFVSTEPIDLQGATEDIVVDAAIEFPPEVTSAAGDHVRLVIEIEPLGTGDLEEAG